MRSALQPYCERPCRPSGPALSHRPGSGGGVRRSCSTAALAVCSPAVGRGPQLGALLPAAPHLPSCSEDNKAVQPAVGPCLCQRMQRVVSPCRG